MKAINWTLTDQEADFVLATLNGTPTNWPIMPRAQLIQKLMDQGRPQPPVDLPKANPDPTLD